MKANIETLRNWNLMPVGTYVNGGVFMKDIPPETTWQVISGRNPTSILAVSSPLKTDVTFSKTPLEEIFENLPKKNDMSINTMVIVRPLYMTDILNNEQFFSSWYRKLWLGSLDSMGHLFFANCRGNGEKPLIFSSINENQILGVDLCVVLEIPLFIEATVNDAKRDGKSPQYPVCIELE